MNLWHIVSERKDLHEKLHLTYRLTYKRYPYSENVMILVGAFLGDDCVEDAQCQYNDRETICAQVIFFSFSKLFLVKLPIYLLIHQATRPPFQDVMMLTKTKAISFC